MLVYGWIIRAIANVNKKAILLSDMSCSLSYFWLQHTYSSFLVFYTYLLQNNCIVNLNQYLQMYIRIIFPILIPLKHTLTPPPPHTLHLKCTTSPPGGAYRPNRTRKSDYSFCDFPLSILLGNRIKSTEQFKCTQVLYKHQILKLSLSRQRSLGSAIIASVESQMAAEILYHVFR